ncbi:MAG: hypothetical protein ACRDL4_07555 [Thermoleophilaceae bacterium]
MSYTTEQIRELLERNEAALGRHRRALASREDVDDLVRELDAVTATLSAAERETVGRYLEELAAAVASRT